MDATSAVTPTPARVGPRSLWTRIARVVTSKVGAYGATAVIGLSVLAPQCAPRCTPPPVPAPSSVIRQVVDITNQRRADNGLPPLAIDATLNRVAQNHSAEQAARRTMSHTGADGSDAGQRISRAGYTWSAWGENVAVGYPDAASVMAGWMNSPGHRANILRGTFTEIGIGLAYATNGAPYWTMDLARPAG